MHAGLRRLHRIMLGWEMLGRQDCRSDRLLGRSGT
jgi:hypothetical protein